MMADELDEDEMFDRLAQSLRAVRQDAELVRSTGAEGMSAALARAEAELRSLATGIEEIRHRIDRQDAANARLEAVAAAGVADLQAMRQAIEALSRRMPEPAQAPPIPAAGPPPSGAAGLIGTLLVVLILLLLLGGGVAAWFATDRDSTLGALEDRVLVRLSALTGLDLGGSSEPANAVPTAAQATPNPDQVAQPLAAAAAVVPAASAPAAVQPAAAVAAIVPAVTAAGTPLAPAVAGPSPAVAAPSPIAAASSPAVGAPSAAGTASSSAVAAPPLIAAASPPAVGAPSAGETVSSSTVAASPPAVAPPSPAVTSLAPAVAAPLPAEAEVASPGTPAQTPAAAPPPAEVRAAAVSPPNLSSAAAASPRIGLAAVLAPPPARTTAAATASPAATVAAAAPPPAQTAAAGPSPPTTPAARAAAPAETHALPAATLGQSSFPPQGGHLLVLRAIADAWVEVRQKGGRVLLTRTLKAGESWTVPAEPDLVMDAGNAEGLDLEVDGVSTRLIGAKGGVIHNVSLDASLLGSGAAVRAAR